MRLQTECTDTVRESALKVDSEKNPLPHRGIEPASAACRSDTLRTELDPHPLCKIKCQNSIFDRNLRTKKKPKRMKTTKLNKWNPLSYLSICRRQTKRKYPCFHLSPRKWTSWKSDFVNHFFDCLISIDTRMFTRSPFYLVLLCLEQTN